MKRYKEHLAKAKNPKQYATEHTDQLSAYDAALTTLKLNKVPTELVKVQRELNSYHNISDEI